MIPIKRTNVGDMATNLAGRYLQTLDGFMLPIEAQSQFEEIDFVLFQGGEPKLIDAKGSLKCFHREHRNNKSIGSSWSMGVESLVKHQSWDADVHYMFSHPEVDLAIFTCTAKSLRGEPLHEFTGTDGKPAIVVPDRCVVPVEEVFG